MVTFLASDLSAYTTGTIITIDGGAANRGPMRPVSAIALAAGCGHRVPVGHRSESGGYSSGQDSDATSDCAARASTPTTGSAVLSQHGNTYTPDKLL